jgi:hypothetical protein
MDQTRENYEQQRVKTDISYKEWGRQNKTSRMELPADRANTLALKTSQLYYLPMSEAIVFCSIIT